MESLTGKEGRLAILMHKLGVLSNEKSTCKYCGKKIAHKLLLTHIKEVHGVGSYY